MTTRTGNPEEITEAAAEMQRFMQQNGDKFDSVKNIAMAAVMEYIAFSRGFTCYTQDN